MKSNAKFILLCLFAAAIFISGCAVIRPVAGRAAIKCSAPVKACIAGASVKGKSIKYAKFGDGPNTTLLIGI